MEIAITAIADELVIRSDYDNQEKKRGMDELQ